MTINPTQKTVWDAARSYLDSGFSVIPCRENKKPTSDWRVFTVNRVHEKRLEHWFVDLAYPSIGLVGGRISDNIVFIDLDGIPAVKLFHENFPWITNHTRSILTGSQQGIHLYLRCVDMPKNTNVRVAGVGGFEIRATGQYVIAPPSPHPSGHNYSVHRDHPIMETDNIDDVYEWMQSLKQNSNASQEKLMSSHARPQSIAEHTKAHYINRAISLEIARVESATQGNRNNALFKASMKLAGYSVSGYIVWSEVVARLSMASQLPYAETMRTIASGYRIGSQNPKVIS